MTQYMTLIYIWCYISYITFTVTRQYIYLGISEDSKYHLLDSQYNYIDALYRGETVTHKMEQF